MHLMIFSEHLEPASTQEATKCIVEILDAKQRENVTLQGLCICIPLVLVGTYHHNSRTSYYTCWLNMRHYLVEPYVEP